MDDDRCGHRKRVLSTNVLAPMGNAFNIRLDSRLSDPGFIQEYQAKDNQREDNGQD